MTCEVFAAGRFGGGGETQGRIGISESGDRQPELRLNFRVQRTRGSVDLGPDLQSPFVVVLGNCVVASIGVELGIEGQDAGMIRRIGRVESVPDRERAVREPLRTCGLAHPGQRRREICERTGHVAMVSRQGLFADRQCTLQHRERLCGTSLFAVHVCQLGQRTRHERVILSEGLLPGRDRAAVLATRRREIAQARFCDREVEACRRDPVVSRPQP